MIKFSAFSFQLPLQLILWLSLSGWSESNSDSLPLEKAPEAQQFTEAKGFITTNVKGGLYIVDKPDSTTDKKFYQKEAVNLYGGHGALRFALSYKYSDYRELRILNNNVDQKLSIAKVSYDWPTLHLLAEGGRAYHPLIARSLYLDGAKLEWSPGPFIFSGFAGITTPNQEDPNLFVTDTTTLAGSISAAWVLQKHLRIDADYLRMDPDEIGSLGLNSTLQPCRFADFNAYTIFQADSSEFLRSELTMGFHLREKDRAILRLGREDQHLDSGRYYEYFIEEPYTYANLGYQMHLYSVQVALDAGTQVFDNSTALIWTLSADWNGMNLTLNQGIEDKIATMGLNFSGEKTLHNCLTLSGAYGLTFYELRDGKRETWFAESNGHREAWYLETGIQWRPRKNLEVESRYEFLSNKKMEEDHRFYAGIRYRLHQVWGVK